MPNPNGITAERAAVEYLTTKGFLVLATNYQTRYGEIDIVATKEGVLIFAEVKSSNKRSAICPLDRVNLRKQKKMIRTAANYLTDHPVPSGDVRFDVVGMVMVRKDEWQIEHIEGAFTADGILE